MAVFFFLSFFSQTPGIFSVFEMSGKKGIKKNGQVFIQAVYDTVLLPSVTQPFCIVCQKKEVSVSTFIKSKNKKWFCTYLTQEGRPWSIYHPDKKDTIKEFSLPRDSVRRYHFGIPYYYIPYDKKFFVFDTRFRLVYPEPHTEIIPLLSGRYFILADPTSAGNLLYGLFDENKTVIVEPRFSNLSFFPTDSVLTGCVSGLAPSGSDEVLNLQGKTLYRYPGHIVSAGKKMLCVRPEVFEGKYRLVRIADGKEVNIPSETIPGIHDTTMEITRNKRREIYTFDKALKTFQP